MPANQAASNVVRITPEEDTIIIVAEEISCIIRGSGFDRRCRIGELIFTQVFCASRLAWRARSSPAHVSFRSLSKLLRGKISKSELHRSVNTWLLCKDLAFVSHSPHLTISHADAVDGLPRQLQSKLLKDAEGSGWSVRQLIEARRRLDLADDTRRGRPARSLSQRLASRGELVVRVLQAMERELNVVGDTTLEDAHVAHLRKCVDSIRASYTSLAQTIQRHQPDADDAVEQVLDITR